MNPRIYTSHYSIDNLNSLPRPLTLHKRQLPRLGLRPIMLAVAVMAICLLPTTGLAQSAPTAAASSPEISTSVNSGVQFGISSLRFKDQIADMGSATNKLYDLRPVTFFYKPQFDDGSRRLQYGLIAEEVALVQPDLVVYEPNGTPYGIRYEALAPMLLNELQKQNDVAAEQHKVVEYQGAQVDQVLKRMSTLESRVEYQDQQIDYLQKRISELESRVGG